jgi:ABC-type lipopolysaccharide export system ATPase subunit
MPLLKATPILAYLDRDATVAFYENLGPKNTGCYVYVDKIDVLYKECEVLGIVHPNGKLQTMAWGMRQFSILDNSGNIIHFGQDIKS